MSKDCIYGDMVYLQLTRRIDFYSKSFSYENQGAIFLIIGVVGKAIGLFIKGLIDACYAILYLPKLSCKAALWFVGKTHVCDEMVNFYCSLFTIVGNLMVEASNYLLTRADKPFRTLVEIIESVEAELWFDVEGVSESKTLENRTGSYAEGLESIRVGVEERFEVLASAMEYISVVALLIWMYGLFRANSYRRKFMKFDSFDNEALTWRLAVLDDRKSRLGRPTLFPLRISEQLAFRWSTSLLMTENEISVLKTQVFILILFLSNSIILVLLDYILHGLVTAQSKIIEAVISTKPPVSKVDVNRQVAI